MNREWQYNFRAHRGAWLAAAMFVLVFALYIAKHQAGWTVPVLTTATNKGVLLAIVAMAQTLPVLTAGIDLSVGMIFVLANCLASHLVVGTPLQGGAGHRRGARGRRAVRPGQRADHRRRPAAADHHDARHRHGLLRPRARAEAGARR